MGVLKKKDKKADIKLDENGKPLTDGTEGEESLGSKIVLAIVTLLIILIWLAIIVVLIKFDVGGFGSTILRPIIKDIPYINMILPESDIEDDAAYQFETIEDAVDRIKELEGMLDASLGTNSTDAQTIAELKAQIEELQKYKDEQDYFEGIKEKFYEEVVYAENGPGEEAFQKYYASMNPTTAEYLYKQVVVQLEESKEIQEYALTYAQMKPKQAAGIFEEMSKNLELVAKILGAMNTEQRGEILGVMDPKIAAQLTKIMNPED